MRKVKDKIVWNVFNNFSWNISHVDVKLDQHLTFSLKVLDFDSTKTIDPES